MRHGSLFSGIGGFDLAAEWMGWENMFHCEWNEFGQKILNYYWPKAKSYGDITKTDFNEWCGKIDIVSGGFPCQPYSLAGKRKGKEDERHLWPEMLRAIREIQPRWVVGENVLGLVNWSGGLVFHEVQADLEAAGYEVWPYVLPACGVNAPHRRDRIWFVAHAGSNVHKGGLDNGGYKPKENGGERENQQQSRWDENGEWLRVKSGTSGKTITNSQCLRQSGPGRPKRSVCKKTFGDGQASWSYDDGRWPTQPPLYFRDDGISARLDTETISEKDWLEGSLSAAGNAIVPQVVYQIFKSIEAYEIHRNRKGSS